MYKIINDGLVAEIQRTLESVKIVRTDEEIDRAIEARVEELNLTLGYQRGRDMVDIAGDFPWFSGVHHESFFYLIEAEGGVYDRLEIANEEALYDMRPDAW